MGNNPVGKKVNTPKVNTEVNTFLLLALGFYLNPTVSYCRHRELHIMKIVRIVTLVSFISLLLHL